MTLIDRVAAVLQREREAGDWRDWDVAIEVQRAVCSYILGRALDARAAGNHQAAAVWFDLLSEISPSDFPAARDQIEAREHASGHESLLTFARDGAAKLLAHAELAARKLLQS